MQSGTVTDVEKTEWTQARDFLSSFSGSRAKAGFSPAQTATFVFSLKEPLFSQLRKDVSDGQALADEIWNVSLFLDQLALFTTEVYQKSREEVILRQQNELLELSTPVVRLWDNVLALPLIGTLDSARTQVVMQNLLEAIVDTRSDIAIIDITGVPTVDTLVAQHLLKTVAAARLMGADCIISGIRPQIAQTIIHLGVNLEDVTTKATLADAFAVALKQTRVFARKDGIPERDKRGADSDSENGRVPPGHHPGGHARPARLDAAGRPDGTIVKHHARGVLIDISALEMVDSFIGTHAEQYR